MHTLLIAQGKIFVDMKRSSTVDVVTKEKIEQFNFRNLEDVLRFDPVTHHLNSRVITYDFNDPVIDKRVDKIFYDGKNQPAYLQSVTTNISGVTIEAIEEVWRNKDLVQGYQWRNFAGDQWARLYDDASNKYVPYNFQPQWRPMFVYTPPMATDIQIIDPSKWKTELANERAMPDGTTTLPNNTYSDNGRSEFKRWRNGDTRIKEQKIYDARGVLREYYYSETYPDDYMYEEITYYDCRGERIYFESTWYDDEDYEIDMVDIIYKNGRPVAGIRDVDDWDEEGPYRFRQYFNPSSQQFEYLLSPEWKYRDYVFNLKDWDDPCDRPDHYITIGPRLILEDTEPERFSTIGGQLSYTYMLGNKLGITADVGVTTGKQFDWRYTKLNAVIGPTLYPFNCAQLDDPFSINAHLYVGLSQIKGKYSMGSISYSSSDNYFTGVAGVDGFYNFTPRFSIKAGANLNMNFGKKGGDNSYNYLFDLGGKYSF